MNPNTVNNFFGIKVSKNGIPVQNASDKQLVYKNDYSTTTWYDESNSRIVEGLLPDRTYGLWVSKPGFDVTDPNAVANNQLIFNSNQDIFKIALSDVTTIPTSVTNTSTIAIPHGLSFIPIVMAVGEILGNYVPFPIININPNTGIILSLYQAYADTTNVYFQVIVPGGTVGSTTSVRYYLLQETAN